MSRRAGILLTALFLAFSLVSARNYAEVDMWFSGLTGTVVDTTNDDPSTNSVDLKDDLNIEDENFYFFYVNFHNVGYGRISMDYHGDGVVNRNFSFGGKTYTARERVLTDVSLSMNDVDYHWYFSSSPLAESYGIVRLRYIDASVRVESATEGVEEESANIPVPMIGLGFSSDLASLVRMRAEALWIGYAGNHFVDARAGVSYSLASFNFLTAVGYRYMRLKADVEDASVDITVKGPYLFFEYGF